MPRSSDLEAGGRGRHRRSPSVSYVSIVTGVTFMARQVWKALASRDKDDHPIRVVLKPGLRQTPGPSPPCAWAMASYRLPHGMLRTWCRGQHGAPLTPDLVQRGVTDVRAEDLTHSCHS